MIAMEQKLASLSFLDIYTGCFVKIRTFLYVGFEIHHSLHIKTSNQLKIVLSCLIAYSLCRHRIVTKQTAKKLFQTTIGYIVRKNYEIPTITASYYKVLSHTLVTREKERQREARYSTYKKSNRM